MTNERMTNDRGFGLRRSHSTLVIRTFVIFKALHMVAPAAVQ
jgi:hypothetical protein